MTFPYEQSVPFSIIMSDFPKNNQNIKPSRPVAPKRPFPLHQHQDERIDPWHWLQDKNNPEVIKYLEEENAYTASVLASNSSLEETLYNEIVGRIKETDLSVPVKKGNWLYYSRTIKGLQYPIHCRKAINSISVNNYLDIQDSSLGQEQILLDENALAEGHDFFSLGAFAISPNHNFLAYSVDTTGSELYTIFFKDLNSGENLDEVLENTYYGIAWANDSNTVFFTRPDETMRPFQLWRHQLQSDQDDQCVYTEEDPRFFLGISKTKDDAFLVIEVDSKTTSEVHVLDANEPFGNWICIEPRRQGIEYSLTHHKGNFIILTNDEAKNFKLVKTSSTNTARQNWETIIPAKDTIKIEAIDIFSNYLVVLERVNANEQISILEFETNNYYPLEQPEEVFSAWPSANPEFDTNILRFGYTSLVTPTAIYAYDMENKTRTLLKQQEVLGNYNPNDYETKRLWAKAEDGTNIPISVVYSKKLELNGKAPCLLYGYGAYETNIDPFFSSSRISLLERGFIFAIAHVRGGGELGRTWYEEGKILNKKNTFTDFISCANYLIENKWTSPKTLVARGGSAGGMLMGAIANMAPELFSAIVAEVPFVDCLSTICDPNLPLTVLEWEEWGNPLEDKDVYYYMKSYSPYDNVTTQNYPKILATAGLSDPRVSFWEPAKWVAKLRDLNPEAKILLKTEMGAGHMGPSGRYAAWRDEAFILAFIISCTKD